MQIGQIAEQGLGRSMILLAALLLALAPGAAAAAAGDTEANPCALAPGSAAGRPDPEGTPTRVSAGVYVLDVVEIEDARQSFVADFYFVVRWRDPRLSAAQRGTSLAACNLSLDAVWHPQVTILNQRNLDAQLPRIVRLDAAGWVEYRQRFYGNLSAPFELQDFPFDRQMLPITLVAVGSTAEEVALAVDQRTGGMPRFSVAGWSLELAEPRIGTQYVAPQDRHFPRIEFALEARRDAGFYVSKMLVPLILIVLMAWCVFWIDPAIPAPQIGLSTATVFSLIAFQMTLGNLLPRVSYLTRADKFLLGATLLVFMALGETIATVRLARTGKEELANAVDRWARWIYIALFAGLVTFTLWA